MLLGRAKDMVKSGGENVFAPQVRRLAAVAQPGCKGHVKAIVTNARGGDGEPVRIHQMGHQSGRADGLILITSVVPSQHDFDGHPSVHLGIACPPGGGGVGAAPGGGSRGGGGPAGRAAGGAGGP